MFNFQFWPLGPPAARRSPPWPARRRRRGGPRRRTHRLRRPGGPRMGRQVDTRGARHVIAPSVKPGERVPWCKPRQQERSRMFGGSPRGNTNRVVSNRVVSKGPLYPSKTETIISFAFWYDPVYMPLIPWGPSWAAAEVRLWYLFISSLHPVYMPLIPWAPSNIVVPGRGVLLGGGD